MKQTGFVWKKWCALIGLACMSINMQPSCGATELESVTMPDVTVFAARYPADEYVVPANVTLLSQEKITGLGGSWMSVLNAFRGLHMRSLTSSPVQMEPALRGFGENAQGRLLVLYNGMRLNRPDMAGLNWLSMPLDDVESIELDRGAASASYGNYAVAGVMHIQTKPLDKPVIRVEAGSDGMLSGSMGASLKEDGHTGSIRVRDDESDGYRDSSDYHASAISGDYTYENKALRIGLNALAQDLFYQLPGALTKAEMDQDRRAAKNTDDSVKNHIYRGNMTMALTNDVQSLLVDAGCQRRLINSRMNSYYGYNGVDLDGFSVSPRWLWNADDAWDVLLGADIYYDAMEQKRYATTVFDDEIGDAKVTRTTSAGYITTGIMLPLDVRLEVAGRVEQAVTDANMHSGGLTTVDEKETQQGNTWSFTLSREWEFTRVYAGVHRVYRYPFIDEMASYYGWGDTLYKDIDPEHGLDFELGVSGLVWDQIQWSAEAFQINMKDEIAYNSVTYRNENMDETRRYGLSAGLQDGWGALQWHASLDWTEACFTDGEYDGNDIPLVPEYLAKAGISYWLFDQLSIGMETRYTGKQRLGGDYSNTQESLDAYTTCDLLAHWQALSNVAVFAAVRNIFNEEYASSGYVGYPEAGYYPAAGITWNMGAKVSF